MLRDIRAVLFDLDGTLLDSFQSHLEVYQATLRRFGLPLTADDFRRHYSPSWNEFYGRVGLPPEDWDEASAFWLEEAANHKPQPFPGVAATLRQLRQRFRLGLVTSGSRTRVHADIGRAGIAEFFETIVTGDDVREPKPSPEGLLAALRALGVPGRQALYVGDTQPDYEQSRAADAAFVGVTSGFSPALPLGDYVRLASITELPTFLGTK